MSVLDQIRARTEKLLQEASPKERVFYEYISNGCPENIELGETLTDDLCRDAFVERTKHSASLEALQKSQPLRNIHYTNNLIDLIAASLIDPASERKNIETYIQRHTLRESYLISIALGLELDSNTRLEKDIDRLIELIEIEKTADGASELFTSTLTGVTELFDLIALKKLYASYLEIHPDANKISEYDELLDVSNGVFNVLDNIIVFVVSALTLSGLGTYIFWYLSNKEFYDELQGVVVHLLSVIVLVLIFLGVNVPTQTNFLARARLFILKIIYKLLGLDYLKIRSVLKHEMSDKE